MKDIFKASKLKSCEVSNFMVVNKIYQKADGSTGNGRFDKAGGCGGIGKAS